MARSEPAERDAPLAPLHNAVIRVRGGRWAMEVADVSPWTALVVVAVAVAVTAAVVLVCLVRLLH